MNATQGAAVLSTIVIAAVIGIGTWTVRKVDRETRPAHEQETPVFVAMSSIGGGTGGPATTAPARVKLTPLAEAIARHNIARITELLSTGAKPDAPAGSQTYLHRTATSGDPAVMQALLSHGANPNVRNATGARPLHLAITPALVKLLVAAKADVNATDNNGQTPLHMAANRGARDVAEALLDAGAKTDVRDHAGKTPLDLAVEGQRVETVRLLHARTSSRPAPSITPAQPGAHAK